MDAFAKASTLRARAQRAGIKENQFGQWLQSVKKTKAKLDDVRRYLNGRSFDRVYTFRCGAVAPYLFIPTTAMRIGELLALRWADVDLDDGTVTTRAEDNKAGRDETLPLHPAVIEDLYRVRGFSQHVFPWLYNERTLYAEFHRIQEAAGIVTIEKSKGRKLRPKIIGRPYGFHDLRRSFGSIQATRVEAAVLKRLMRHASVTTTLKFYVNVDGALRSAVHSTPVPSSLRVAH